VLRVGLAGIRTIGGRGVLHRAASSARLLEDDVRYRKWLAAHPHEAPDGLVQAVAQLSYRPLISVIVPVFNTEPRLLGRCLESIRAQVYPHWEICVGDDGSTAAGTRAALTDACADPRIRVVRSDRNAGIAAATNAGLSLATGDFVAFVDHDDALPPEALAEVALRLDASPDLDVVYTDEDKIDEAGERREPHFKPDFSRAQLFSCMYMSHLTVMRRARVMEAGGLRREYEGSQDYDLMLRVTERSSAVAHVPRVLYHWRTTAASAASSQLSKPWAVEAGCRALEDAVRRSGERATVHPTGAAGHFQVRYEVGGTPLVSIVIAAAGTEPARTSEAWHARLAHLAGRTRYRPVEFIVATRDVSLDLGRAGSSANCRMIATGADAAPAQLTVASRASRGDHILLLDADAEPIAGDWLESLVGLSQRPGVGAVGAFLLRPGGVVDHAGIVVGVGRVAAPALAGEPDWLQGHRAMALDVRNCSAVSAACLMSRRFVFESAGGLDSSLPGLYDVDYGLRVRGKGLQVVVTPHVRLTCGSTSARLGGTPADEIARLRATWGAAVDRDPYYNPHFDRQAATFRLPAAN